MAFSFECYAVTHIGNQRKNNEDNFYIGEIISSEEQSSMSQTKIKSISKNIVATGTMNRVFAVSDGMGGHEFGEVASYIVANALGEFSIEQSAKLCCRKKEKFAYIQAFQEMIDQANLKINEFAINKDVAENMGATLSGIIIFSDEVVPFNIGDSTTFVYEKKTLRKLTTDDNEMTMFDGAASQKFEANGKRLTKYFGLPKSSGVLTATITKPAPLKLGQIYMIASDGLTDSLSHNKVSRIIGECTGSIETAANNLLREALSSKNGGHDNITIVMIKTTKTTK